MDYAKALDNIKGASFLNETTNKQVVFLLIKLQLKIIDKDYFSVFAICRKLPHEE